MTSHFLRPLIAAGLAKLAVLNLPGRPAAADLVAVANVWLESLLRHRSDWNALDDSVRIERAFCHLIDHADTWPNPRDLIRVLPPRPDRNTGSLPPPVQTDAQMAANRRRLAELLKMIHRKMEISK